MKIKLSQLRQDGVNDFIFITNILKSNEIKYWLDYGTLLGCVRENKSLSWDGEFDISLWNSELEKFLLIIPILEKNNFFIEFHDGVYYSNDLKYANIKITNKNNFSKGSYTIDFHFYIKSENFAKRPFGGFLFKNNYLQKLAEIFQFNTYVMPFYVISSRRYYYNKELNFASIYNVLLNKYTVDEIEKEIIENKISINKKYRETVIELENKISFNIKDFVSFSLKVKYVLGFCFSILPLFIIKILNPLFLFLNRFPKKIKKEVIVKSYFFEDFIFLDFYNTKQPVPKEFEKYLETIYGDWKTPKLNWDSSSDSDVFN